MCVCARVLNPTVDWVWIKTFHQCNIASHSSKAASYILLGRKPPILYIVERKERMRSPCGVFYSEGKTAQLL